jgi:hypothetical protein
VIFFDAFITVPALVFLAVPIGALVAICFFPGGETE